MTDFSQLDVQVNSTISKIDSFVKNPTSPAPLDNELNGLLQKLNQASNEISDREQLRIHQERIERLKIKIEQYDIARQSIQIQTRTNLGGVSAGKQELQEAREKIKEFDIKNIEMFLKVTNTLVLNRFTGTERQTLEGMRGSHLLNIIQESGFQYRFTPNGISLYSPDPKLANKAAEASLAIDTLIKTGILTLDELKYGLLYTAPSFGSFANNSRLSDGSVNPQVSESQYNEFLKNKPQNQLTNEEKIILESQGSLANVNMPNLVRSFQNLGQVNTAYAKNSDLAKLAQSVPQSTSSVPSVPTAPNNIVQEGANTATGKAGEFAGKTAENIGDFAGGVGQALSKGFEKGGTIGGLAVAIIGIMGAWKFLTGEWGTKNHKLSGWMIALGAFGGKAAIDMMEEYGLIDKAKTAAGKAGKTIKGKVNQLQGSDDGSESDDEETESNKKKPDKKTPDTSNETKNISSSQKLATEKVNNNEDLKKTFEKATPALGEYVDFIHVNLGGITLDKLISDDESSIFAPGAKLDSSISAKLGNLTPNTLKKVLRVYLGSSARFAETKEGTTPGLKEKTALIGELEKHAIKNDKFASTSLGDAVSAIYTTGKVEAKNSPREVVQKIRGYELVYGNEVLPKDNLSIEINEYNEGGYQATIKVKDASKLDSRIKQVDPIIVDFDEAGKIETQDIDLVPIVLGKSIQQMAQPCSLKQQGNQIIITKVTKA